MKKQFAKELGVHGLIGLAAFVLIFGQAPLSQSLNLTAEKTDKAESLSTGGNTDMTPIVQKSGVGDIRIVIEPTAAAAELPRLRGLAKYVTVSATKLKMRRQPTLSSKAMRTYPNGAAFVQIGQQDKWLQVRHVQDGTSGWMHGDYMKPAS